MDFKGFLLNGEKSIRIQQSSVDLIPQHWVSQVQSYDPRVVEQQSALLKGGKLHQYQLQGVAWFYRMFILGLPCLLQDDMGLGKGVQVISLFSLLKEHFMGGTHLIVVPSLTIGWRNLLYHWLPSFNCYCVRNSVDEEVDFGSFDVVVVSQKFFSEHINLFNHTNWSCIVIDDVTRSSCLKKLLLSVSKLQHSSILLISSPHVMDEQLLLDCLHVIKPQLFPSLSQVISTDNLQDWIQVVFEILSLCRRKEDVTQLL
ncbi:hypothetical protein RCL1_002596 [Eukaryota sp. TZLM3-RCL]